MRMIEHWFQWAAVGIEAAGVGIIVLGAILAAVRFLRGWRGGGGGEEPYEAFRADLGRAILLGLEFLVGADIIATVSADATLEGVAVLAAIVAVRTFLSFTIHLEITGRWPWQRRDGR